MDCSDNNRYSNAGLCCSDCKNSYCYSDGGDDDYDSRTSCSNDDSNDNDYWSSSSSHQGWGWNENRNSCCWGPKFYCNEEDHDDDDYQVFGWDLTNLLVEHVIVLAFLFVVFSMVAAARIGAACGTSAISKIGTDVDVSMGIGTGMDD